MTALIHPADSIVLRTALLLCLFAVPLTGILVGLDRRVLDDELLWLKPLKFHISLAVHTITVLIATRLMPDLWQSHLVTRIGLTLFGVVVIYEAVFLSIQAARGVRSHFNDTTLFDAIGGSIMAGGAGVLVLVPLVLGIALIIASALSGWSGILENPMRLAVAVGFILTGWLGAQTGSAMGANAGPFVGVDPSAGPFMPITGWSLTGGDYRVSHFLGVHAMQAIPIMAALLLLVLPPALVAAATLPLAAGWTALTLFTLQRATEGLPPF